MTNLEIMNRNNFFIVEIYFHFYKYFIFVSFRFVVVSFS